MEFEVDQRGTLDSNVVLWGVDGCEAVLALVSPYALEDARGGHNLTKTHLYRLADRHIEALSRIASQKFADGYAFVPEPGKVRRVLLVGADLVASGEMFSSSAVDLEMTWHKA